MRIFALLRSVISALFHRSLFEKEVEDELRAHIQDRAYDLVVGLYGVIAYSLAQRTREIGIRVALGANRASVLLLVVGHGLKLTLIGSLIGLVAAFAVTRLIQSFLFGISATDPVTFAAARLLLVTIACLACYLPARSASRVDPMDALRYE
jgi:putative ABC transport system permease protein